MRQVSPSGNQIVMDQPDLLGRWAAERDGTVWYPERGHAIGVLRNGTPIASVLYDNWTGASICMHIVAEPGTRWLSHQLLYLAFAYPFIQLRVNKILGLVGSGNTSAQRFDEHLGFVLEATLKNAHPDGDLLIYSMEKEQCRWLTILKENPHELRKTQGSPAA